MLLIRASENTIKKKCLSPSQTQLWDWKCDIWYSLPVLLQLVVNWPAVKERDSLLKCIHDFITAAQQWQCVRCSCLKGCFIKTESQTISATPSCQLHVMQCIHLLPPAAIFLFFCLLLLSEWSGLRGRTEAYPCSASVQEKKKKPSQLCYKTGWNSIICNATYKVSLLLTLVSLSATNNHLLPSLPKLVRWALWSAVISIISWTFCFWFWRHHTVYSLL